MVKNEPFLIVGDGVKLLTSNDGSLIHYFYILLQNCIILFGIKRSWSNLQKKDRLNLLFYISGYMNIVFLVLIMFLIHKEYIILTIVFMIIMFINIIYFSSIKNRK